MSYNRPEKTGPIATISQEIQDTEVNFTNPEYLAKQPLPNQGRSNNLFSKVTRPSIFDKQQNQIVQESTSLPGHRGKVLFEYGNPTGEHPVYNQGNSNQKKERFQIHDLDYETLYNPVQVNYGDLINYDIPILGEHFEKKPSKPSKSRHVHPENDEDDQREIIDFTEGFQNCDVVNININEPFESKIFGD